MFKLKQKAAIMVVFCIFISIFLVSCRTNELVNNEGDQNFVTLKMLLLGVRQRDSEAVWGRFNEELNKVLPNTKVDFQMIAAPDFKQKWDLMAAASEEVDIAWTGWLVAYVEEVRKGAYKPLDELIDKYAPNIRTAVPDWVLEKAIVDGEIYSIPNYQLMTQLRTALAMPKDISDKYPDLVQDIRDAYKTDDYKLKLEKIENLLEQLKQNNELKKGIKTPWLSGINLESITSPLMIKHGDREMKVFNYHETEIAKYEYDTYAEWYKKGYIRPDLITVNNLNDDRGKKDGYCLWNDDFSGGDFRISEEVLNKKYGFEVTLIPERDYEYIGGGVSSTSITIPRTSKNPERAMKLISILNDEEHKDLYNLLVYGFEGQHYKKIGDNRIELLPGAGEGSENTYGIPKYSIANTMNAWEISTDFEGYRDIVEEIHGNAMKSLLMGFQFDTSSIENERTQVAAVRKEYNHNVIFALPNHEELYQQFLSKLQQAGVNKIRDEAQRQIDEFARNKGLK